MPSGMISAILRQRLLHRLRNLERIGRRLLDHAERHRRVAHEAGDRALVARADLRLADILQPDQVAAGVADDQVVELLGRAQVGLGQHGELALLALDPARRHLDVLPPQRRLDVLRREAVGGQPQAVEPDAHRRHPRAEDPHLGHAGQVLQPVLDEAVGDSR